MKEVAVNRLNELYQFIPSMTTSARHSKKIQKRIIPFCGAFSDMSDKDYSDFLYQTKLTRMDFFIHKLKEVNSGE